MYFEIIGEIESIAVGTSVGDIARLRRRYGTGRWRKLKGMPLVPREVARYIVLKSLA